MNALARKPSAAPRVDGPLAEKLVKAGFDTAAASLRVTAEDILRRTKLDTAEAALRLAEAVRAAPALLPALARFYIERVAADMRGESLPGVVNVHAPGNGSHHLLPARHPDDVAGGHLNSSTPVVETEAPPAASPDGAASGQLMGSADAVAMRAPAAAPPIRSGGGRGSNSLPQGQTRISPAAAGPSAGAIAARLAAKASGAAALMKTFLVDGRPIGEISFGEARRLGRAAGVTHYVLAAIVAHVQCPDDTLIGEAIREADLARFIENARRDADVF